MRARHGSKAQTPPMAAGTEGFDPMDLAAARSIVMKEGWLSFQPEPFQMEVLRRATLVRYAPNDIIYRLGDPAGGIYGLVEGAVRVVIGPPAVTPRLFHLAFPGSWIGEGGFIARQPRRVGMEAAVATRMFHLPLSAMDKMEQEDSTVVRRFAQIILFNLDTLVHTFDDILKMEGDQRVAASLRRMNGAPGEPIPITQAELGAMSNVSRKHANAALKRFEAAGWLKTGYRSLAILNPAELSRFADSEMDD